MSNVGIRGLARAVLVLCATGLCGCANGLGGSRLLQEMLTMPFVFEGDEIAWDVGHSTGDDVQQVTEFVRTGQTVENWTELVTVQTLNKSADLGTVDDQIAVHRSDLVGRCPGSAVDVIRQTPDGVLYEVRVVNCPQGADERGLARVLEGTSNRFVVQYAVRGAVTLTPERRAEWIDKLMAVEIMSLQ